MRFCRSPSSTTPLGKGFRARGLPMLRVGCEITKIVDGTDKDAFSSGSSCARESFDSLEFLYADALDTFGARRVSEGTSRRRQTEDQRHDLEFSARRERARRHGVGPIAFVEGDESAQVTESWRTVAEVAGDEDTRFVKVLSSGGSEMTCPTVRTNCHMFSTYLRLIHFTKALIEIQRPSQIFG